MSSEAGAAPVQGGKHKQIVRSTPETVQSKIPLFIIHNKYKITDCNRSSGFYSPYSLVVAKRKASSGGQNKLGILDLDLL